MEEARLEDSKMGGNMSLSLPVYITVPLYISIFVAVGYATYYLLSTTTGADKAPKEPRKISAKMKRKRDKKSR